LILQKSKINELNTNVRGWLENRDGKLLNLTGYATIEITDSKLGSRSIIVGDCFAVHDFELPILKDTLLPYLIGKIDTLKTEKSDSYMLWDNSISIMCLLTLRPTSWVDYGVVLLYIELLNQQKVNNKMVFIDGSVGQRVCKDYDDKDPELLKTMEDIRNHDILIFVCMLSRNNYFILSHTKNRKKTKFTLTVIDNQNTDFKKIKSWSIPIIYILYKSLIKNLPILECSNPKQFSKIENKFGWYKPTTVKIEKYGHDSAIGIFRKYWTTAFTVHRTMHTLIEKNIHTQRS
jgi:hypothetical protein